VAEDETYTDVPDLEREVAKGTRLTVLKAIAALAAHELAGNRCQKCHMSYMKTGEISSLMLRLQKVYEDIEALEDDVAARTARDDADEKSGKPKRRGLSDIKRDRTHLQVVGQTNPEDPGLPEYGTRSAPRRQGGRKSRG
jgi:hypothetical protein